MKKTIIALTAFFTIFAGKIFAQQGFNVSVDGEFQSPFIFQPLLAVDVKAEYEFSNEIGLGLGTKTAFNVTQQGWEPYVYVNSYLLFTYKNFDLGAGVNFNTDTIAESSPVLPFITIGGNIPIFKNATNGNLKITLGSDFYVSLRDFAANAESGEEAFGAALASIFLLPLSIPKLYVGVKYTIPVQQYIQNAKAYKAVYNSTETKAAEAVETEETLPDAE